MPRTCERPVRDPLRRSSSGVRGNSSCHGWTAGAARLEPCDTAFSRQASPIYEKRRSKELAPARLLRRWRCVEPCITDLGDVKLAAS